MKKKILGIAAIAMIAFANLHLVSSDETMERLIMLNDIESIADENEYDILNGKILRSFYCESGNEYYECVYANAEDKCHYLSETFCGAGDSPAEGGTESSGEANDLCSNTGHIFSSTLCYTTCIRCGLTTKNCED